MFCTLYKGTIYILKNDSSTSVGTNKEMLYARAWYIIKNKNEPNVIEKSYMYINQTFLKVEY